MESDSKSVILDRWAMERLFALDLRWEGRDAPDRVILPRGEYLELLLAARSSQQPLELMVAAILAGWHPRSASWSSYLNPHVVMMTADYPLIEIGQPHSSHLGLITALRVNYSLQVSEAEIVLLARHHRAPVLGCPPSFSGGMRHAVRTERVRVFHVQHACPFTG